MFLTEILNLYTLHNDPLSLQDFDKIENNPELMGDVENIILYAKK
jgi:hypothetical protein